MDAKIFKTFLSIIVTSLNCTHKPELLATFIIYNNPMVKQYYVTALNIRIECTVL